MKYFILTLILILAVPQFRLKAQDTITEPQPIEESVVTGDQSDDEPGVWFVDVNATFRGGDLMKFNKWITENVKYPPDAVLHKIQGKVIAQFSVNKTGKVCDIKIIKSVHPLLDQEAIRVLSCSPDWKPAKQNGQNVKQLFTIPLVFSLK
jgi:TonB family protein